jgi:hypothetical protein
MRQFTGETFLGGRIGRDDATEDGYVFEKCWFQGSEVSVGRSESTHVRVSNVELRRCRVSGGGLLGVHLVDCRVDGLQVSSFPRVLGCVFEHVTLAGKINKLMIRPELPTVDNQAPFLAAAAEAYERIDWALDISEVDAYDLEIKGIPSRLIRRDPETQAVVRREALEGKPWSEIDYSGTYFSVAMDRIVLEGWPEVILVAPRTGPKKEAFLRVITDLRAIGVAEQG